MASSEIPRELLDTLTNEINALSAAGQQMVLNALANATWSSVTELRVIMSEVMDMVCSEIAGMSAARAAGFYDDVRQLAVGKKLGALSDSVYNAAATTGAVRALVQSVVDTGSTDRFARDLAARVDYEAKKAAGECVERNAKRDPLKPRWARVPSGAETCSFCLMLASRGFVYHSEKKAGSDGHYHPHCDCRIVPGFYGMEVEGYDTGELYQHYLDDIETKKLKPKGSGGRSKRNKWTSTQFESYSDFTKYINEAESIEDLQLRCEVAASEWEKTNLKAASWSNLRRTVMYKRAHLDDRGFGAIYEKPRASLLPHEKQGVDWLVKNGIRPTVKQEDPTAPANIDFEIDGDLWEMKNVHDGKHAIEDRMRDASKKWQRLGLNDPVRVVITSEGRTKSAQSAIDDIKRHMRYADEVLFIDQEGNVSRIQK